MQATTSSSSSKNIILKRHNKYTPFDHFLSHFICIPTLVIDSQVYIIIIIIIIIIITELNDLYSSSTIVRLMKSRRMR
jgi:hypothetical protein